MTTEELDAPLVTPCTRCNQVHLRCRAHSKRSGGPCRGWPVHGLRVCWKHGGATATAQRLSKRRLAIAQVGEMLGVPKNIDPANALLETLRLAAGDAEYLRYRVAALEADQAATIMGVHPLVELYNQALERVAKLSDYALRAGIAERYVRIAESQAQLIAAVVIKVLDDEVLGLTSRQRALGRELSARALLALPEASTDT